MMQYCKECNNKYDLGSKVFEKASADKTTAETKGKYYAEISVYNISKVCNTIKIYNKTKLRKYSMIKIK